MTIRFSRGLIASAAVMLLAPACTKAPPVKTPPVPVELARVTTISAPLTIDANGVVEPLQTVSVLPQVGGALEAVEFHEGDAADLGDGIALQG